MIKTSQEEVVLRVLSAFKKGRVVDFFSSNLTDLNLYNKDSLKLIYGRLRKSGDVSDVTEVGFSKRFILNKEYGCPTFLLDQRFNITIKLFLLDCYKTFTDFNPIKASEILNKYPFGRGRVYNNMRWLEDHGFNLFDILREAKDESETLELYNNDYELYKCEEGYQLLTHKKKDKIENKEIFISKNNPTNYRFTDTKYKTKKKELTIEKYIFTKAKQGATSRKLEYSITEKEIKEILEKQNYKCVYTGRDLEINPTSPDTVSMDRVDSTKGYTKDNVVMCTSAANMAKNDLSTEEFKILIKDIYNTLFTNIPSEEK